MNTNTVTPILPETGFLRLSEIIGDRKAKPPIHGFIPVSKSTWFLGVKNGIYPKPIRISTYVSAWRVEDIRALIASMGTEVAA